MKQFQMGREWMKVRIKMEENEHYLEEELKHKEVKKDR